MVKISDRRLGERRSHARRQIEAESDNRLKPERRKISRRTRERIVTALRVDYRLENTFMFAYATNISTMGIFIESREPPERGAILELRFPSLVGVDEIFNIKGEVVWISKQADEEAGIQPGMGIKFIKIGKADHQKLKEALS